MIKKIVFTFLVLFTCFSYLPAQSFEVGVSVGKDFYEIPDLSTGFNLQDLTKAQLSRKGFSNPIAYGLQLTYHSANNFSFGLESSFNYLEYNVKYTRNVPKLIDPFYIKTTNYKIPWARLGTMLVFNYIPYSISNVDFIIGGGLGLQIFAPAVSDKFIYKTLLNKLSDLDISKDIELNYSFSQKINAGIKYGISKTNINVSLITSYTFVNNPKDEAPDNFLGMEIRLSYLFKK